jgi:serine/threonine protein kinase
MADSSEGRSDESSRDLAPSSEPAASRRVIAGMRLVERFTIERKLGQGGMGRVFAAFDETRQTRVALKTLMRPSRSSLAQLEHEFRIASELFHPNLVRLHEFFSDGPDWFFTMELVDGDTLPELMGRGFDESKLERVFRELSCAIAALHGAGILHGDLKPSNFLISKETERVVLLDFGLARPVGDVALELAGGTPLYMSPEQLAGAELTEASDWYSFGVVLFEALTGNLPVRETLHEELVGAPELLATLAAELLRAERHERPTGRDVLERLGAALGE